MTTFLLSLYNLDLCILNVLGMNFFQLKKLSWCHYINCKSSAEAGEGLGSLSLWYIAVLGEEETPSNLATSFLVFFPIPGTTVGPLNYFLYP